MRVSLAVSGSLYRCAFSKATMLMVAMLATVCGGAVAPAAAGAAVPAKPVAKKKKPAAAVKDPAAPALPNGHVGQEYETRIGGVMLAAGEELHCSGIAGLPAGLELNCKRLLIHGHPQAAVSEAPVSFTVADDENNTVSLKFKLTVLDGPDVVQWVGSPAAGKKAKERPAAAAPAGGQASLPGTPADEDEGRHAAVVRRRPETQPEPDLDAEASAPDADAEPVQRRAAVARVIAAVAMTGELERPVNGGHKDKPKAEGGGHHGHHPPGGVGIELDPETPFVEGATTIKGKIVNDTEQVSHLCVALRQQDETLTEGGDRESYAALTAVKGNPCLSVEAQVKDGEFSMALTSPIKAGFEYDFAVRSSSTDEAIPVKDGKHYTISLELPVPVVEVTSLIRDGVKTISGSCKALPSPALATNAAATPAFVGNLPRVVVELHDPNAPGGPKKHAPGLKDGIDMEWHTADLLVGDTKSQKTVESDEATASADGCTFNVTLKTALAPGQLVRVKLKAPAGRYFGPQKKTEVMWPEDEGRMVFTALALAPPLITSHLAVGGTSIAGTATPSPSNGTQVTIAAISDDEYEDLKGKNGIPGNSENKDEYLEKRLIAACRSPEEMKKYSGRFLQLSSGSSVVTSSTGTFTLSLANPLVDGQRFHLVEILPAKSKLTDADRKDCTTTVNEVKGDLDWGRIHADFVGGVLISNDSSNSTTGASGAGSGNFSQAHQFLALNVEKSWLLPGCYLSVPAHRSKGIADDEDDRDDTEDLKPQESADQVKSKPAQCLDWHKQRLVDAVRLQRLTPGVSTYFQTRLTAIPVSTVSTTGTATAMASNIISTAQTARVEVGTYFPVFLTRWDYDSRPNALFLAPLAKVGFDTVTGPSTVNTITTGGGGTQSQTLEQVYTYWSYGMKIGHMELTRTENKAPETFSYLDISFGPYSSLQSYICHNGAAPVLPTGTTSTSSCATDYKGENLNFDSRKRLYRFDVEGLLKIPKTLLYVGLNANIGQKTLGATHLDHGFAAPDDIRFLFGTKFDVASVLSKFKFGPQ